MRQAVGYDREKLTQTDIKTGRHVDAGRIRG